MAARPMSRVNSASKAFLTAMILLAFPLTSYAQNVALSIAHVKPPSPQQGFVEAVVSVVEETEKAVKGLTADHFSVYLENAEVGDLRVRPVSQSTEGIAVLLAIDVSGSMKGRPIESARAAVGKFVDQLGPYDICAVLSFGSTTQELVPFTRDIGKLKSAVEKIRATDKTTKLYQAFYDSASKAAVAPLMRTAVVILTDGRDEGSPITLDDAIAHAEKRNIPMYPLGFGSKMKSEPLARIAKLTGGRFLSSPDVEALESLYSQVAEQMKNQYLLTIPVKSMSAGQHTLRVELSYRGSKLTAAKEFMSAALVPTPTPPEQRFEKPSSAPLAQQPAVEDSGGRSESRPGSLTFPLVGAVFAVALIAVFLFLRSRRRKADSRTCPWCGDPLGAEDGLYCAKCKAESGSRDGPEGDRRESKPDKDSLVWLDVVAGPLKEGKRTLLAKAALTIGRGPENGFDIRDEEMSHKHAQISLDAKGHYVIEDLQSRNGTYVNERRTNRQTLRNGDRIRLGATELVFADHRDPR